HCGTDRPRSFVVVSNHRSTLDAVTLPVAALLISQASIRWFVKLGINWYPMVRGMMDGNGYAKVARRKDLPNAPDDVRRRFNRMVVARFIRLVREEGASVGIFPEGERFVSAKPGARRKHVGELVGAGSFRELCEKLPDHGVAVVTVLWPTLPEGKTVLAAADLCDRTIEITVDLYPNPRDPGPFLERAFDRMDADLEAVLTRSPDHG
ncbi:hypothetical protein EBS80_05290, partial [bacterium]|nr:hypothetical protein [bacterium]